MFLNGKEIWITRAPDTPARLFRGLSESDAAGKVFIRQHIPAGCLSAKAPQRTDEARGSGSNQPWPTVALVDTNFTNPIALTVFACSQTEMLLSPVPGTPTGTKYLKVTAGWDNTLVIIYQTPLSHV